MNEDTALLTIAIPTFNRAKELERQVQWALSAIEGHQERVVLLVSDNASTDATPRLVAGILADNHSVQCVRQSKNLGLIGNYRYCIEAARSQYVWVVGDDDRIETEALPKILAAIQKHPQVGLVHMNHRCFDGVSRRCIHGQLYSAAEDHYSEGGSDIVERLLLEAEGGVLFLTANVVRRDLAVRAMEEWQWRPNLGLPTFVNVKCAVSGGIQYLGAPMCDCIYGTGSWRDDSFILQYVDLPLIYLLLARAGLRSSVAARLLGRRIDWKILRGAGSYVLRRVIRAKEGRERTW